MSSKMIESSIVYPSEETPKGPLWLSSLDQAIRTPFSHTRALYVYKAPNKAQHVNNQSPFFETSLLKESLSKALVPFNPMAGRLQINHKTGRTEVDCNAEGAMFFEVETTHEIADFGDFTRSPKIKNLCFPKCNYDEGLSSFPLLLVQLTRFKCGGVTLGLMQHHHVADGTSHVHFNNSWARLTRGLDLDVMPFHDRYSCFAPRDPPQIKFRHLEYEPPLPALSPKGLTGEITDVLVEGLFKFTKEQINTLKQQVMSQDETSHTYYTTFEVLAGHIWRTACKSRRLSDDQDVKLGIPCEGRSRLRNPSLPQGYCGNVLSFAACITKAGDIIHKPLWYTVHKVHQALKNAKSSEFFRSAVDYLESQPYITPMIRGPQSSTCPNLLLNSWAKLEANNLADFGWGAPSYFRLAGIEFEGLSYIIESQNEDGSMSLSIKLYSVHMVLFEKYLYEF